MPPRNNQARTKAHKLYTTSSTSYKDIAVIVGVDRSTVANWVTRFNWKPPVTEKPLTMEMIIEAKEELLMYFYFETSLPLLEVSKKLGVNSTAIVLWAQAKGWEGRNTLLKAKRDQNIIRYRGVKLPYLHSCQYPLWDETVTDEFCGKKTQTGSSYCGEHHSLCYEGRVQYVKTG